jgi:hypothetical protein
LWMYRFEQPKGTDLFVLLDDERCHPQSVCEPNPPSWPAFPGGDTADVTLFAHGVHRANLANPRAQEATGLGTGGQVLLGGR